MVSGRLDKLERGVQGEIVTVDLTPAHLTPEQKRKLVRDAQRKAGRRDQVYIIKWVDDDFDTGCTHKITLTWDDPDDDDTENKT